MLRKQVIPKSAEMLSVQCNRDLRLCTGDMNTVGRAVCWRVSTSGSCITRLCSFVFLTAFLSAKQRPCSPSIHRAHPLIFILLLQAHVKNPNYQKHEKYKRLDVNLEGEKAALNKGLAEMWLNASAGRKRPPQDRCNYESFMWRTFRTREWPATGWGGGCCQHYVPPTEPQ